jgi:hypothetical protein
MITANEIRAEIAPDLPRYRTEMRPPASPDTWSPNVRSLELYAIFTWLRTRLVNVPDEIRIRGQNFYSRKSRAREDLYELAAETLNACEAGTVEDYRGR